MVFCKVNNKSEIGEASSRVRTAYDKGCPGVLRALEGVSLCSVMGAP